MSVFIPIVALIALADVSYLLYKKLRKETPVCIIGDSCGQVTKSKYGYFFGIPGEVFGIAFYLGALFLFLLSLLGIEAIAGFSLTTLLFAASVPAVLSSLYFVAIQAFVLKEWCEWCLLSVFANFAIFLLTVP